MTYGLPMDYSCIRVLFVDGLHGLLKRHTACTQIAPIDRHRGWARVTEVVVWMQTPRWQSLLEGAILAVGSP